MIIEFFRNYWREILEIGTICISILICCLKKRPVKVVDTIKELILKVLPAYVISAESSGLKGADKLELVLNYLHEFLREMGYGDDIISQYLPYAKQQVELILTTPHKKGEK